MDNDTKQLLLLIIGGLLYSVVSWAYISKNFVSVESFDLLYNEITYVRSTVDDIRNNQTKGNR